MLISFKYERTEKSNGRTVEKKDGRNEVAREGMILESGLPGKYSVSKM